MATSSQRNHSITLLGRCTLDVLCPFRREEMLNIDPRLKQLCSVLARVTGWLAEYGLAHLEKGLTAGLTQE